MRPALHKQALDDYPGRYAELERAYGEQAAPLNQRVAELDEQLSSFSFCFILALKASIASCSDAACLAKPSASRFFAEYSADSLDRVLSRSRVEVLGTLLGLGVYQIMERIAQDKAKVYGAKNRELKQEVEIHRSTISGFGNPDEELENCRTELAGYESSLQAKIAERDKNKLLLTNQQEAAERRTKLLISLQNTVRIPWTDFFPAP